MKDCATEQIHSKLEEIQKVIDDFDLKDLANLDQWINILNEKIEVILVKRLESMLESWIDEFKDFRSKGGTLIFSKMILDIKLQNRQILLDPPLAEARAYWYKELHN